MLRILLIIALLMFTFRKRVSNYTNYVDYQSELKDMKVNCPGKYNTNYNKVLQQPRTLQPFGYTSNEYLNIIRFMFPDKKPFPVNPDFFYKE